MAEPLEAPKGCTLITEGKLRRSDLVRDIENKTWGHPTKFDYECLGTEVEFYYHACRKTK
jgi:hypothetical protein